MVELIRKRPVELWGKDYQDAPFYQPKKREAQETSLQALPQADFTHEKIETAVLHLLAFQSFTTYELSQVLNKPVNCLTQPIKTLREKGLIVLAGTRQNPTGAYANLWALKRAATKPAATQ